MPVTKNIAIQTTRFIFIPFHAGFDRSVTAPMALCQPFVQCNFADQVGRQLRDSKISPPMQKQEVRRR
jgi:hypothetical protein